MYTPGVSDFTTENRFEIEIGQEDYKIWDRARGREVLCLKKKRKSSGLSSGFSNKFLFLKRQPCFRRTRIPVSLRGTRQIAHEQTRDRVWSSTFVSPNMSFSFVRVKLLLVTLPSLVVLFLKCSQSVDCKLWCSSLSNLYWCRCPWSRGFQITTHWICYEFRRSADWLSY